MTVRMLIPGLLALLLAPAAAVAQDDPYGDYTYVKGMRGDREVDQEELKKYGVKLDESKLSLLAPDGTIEFEIRYVLDGEQGADQYLATLTITKSVMEDAVGTKAKALSRVEGDTITLIYDYAEGADYPADFEPDGPTQHLFVFKKKADDAE